MVGLVQTRCFWERLGDAALPLGLAVFLLLLGVVFVKCLTTTVSAFSNRRHTGWRGLVPAILYLLAMVGVVLDPLGLDCDAFLSPVVERACYEGTVSHVVVKLRANQRFEIQSHGWFSATYHTGHWHREQDTLDLAFDEPPPEEYAETYLIDEKTGRWTAANSDSTARPLPFNQGYCKGLN